MDLEHINGLMEDSIQDNGLKEKWMERVYSDGEVFLYIFLQLINKINYLKKR